MAREAQQQNETTAARRAAQPTPALASANAVYQLKSNYPSEAGQTDNRADLETDKSDVGWQDANSPGRALGFTIGAAPQAQNVSGTGASASQTFAHLKPTARRALNLLGRALTSL